MVDDDDDAMAEINITPLIDVMLVLLIMVIMTIPLQPHLIDLAMPADAVRPVTPPRNVSVDLDAGGTLRWNGDVLADFAALEGRLDDLSRVPDQPELRLRAHEAAAYGQVAAIMAAVQRHGVRKFGLVDTVP